MLQIATMAKKGIAGIGSFMAFLIAGLLLSVFLSAFLFQQQRFYKHENRRLIIENDSLISVNIALRDSLQPAARRYGSHHNQH